jgi:phage gpG-like protein
MQAIAEIGRLQSELRALAEVPRRAAVLLAPKLTELIKLQFRDGKDPYGRAWAALRPATLRKHGPPPLTASGALRDDTRAETPRANYAGVRLIVGRHYGYFHQVGFRVGNTKVAARRILPQFGMPALWRQAIVDSIRESLKSKATRGA